MHDRRDDQGRNTTDNEDPSPVRRLDQQTDEARDGAPEWIGCVDEGDVGAPAARWTALVDERQKVRERAAKAQAGQQAYP